MVRLIILGFFLLAMGFIVVQLVDFFLSINSGSGQIKRDVAELKSKIATYISNLVPMTIKELELLSINETGTTSVQGVSTTRSGAFTSIYHEPLLAYAFKEYKYPAGKRLLLISSEDDDFLYLTDGNKTKVSVNNKELGVIDESGNLYDPKSNNLLAQIEANQKLSSHPVKVGSREVGEVINARLNQSPNPRAYQFIESMDDREMELFKALTFLSLAEESIG